MLRRERSGAAGAGGSAGAAEVLQCCGEGGLTQLEGAAAIRGGERLERPEKGEGWKEKEGSLVQNINERIRPPFLGGFDGRSLPGKPACQEHSPTAGGRDTPSRALAKEDFFPPLPPFLVCSRWAKLFFPLLKAELSKIFFFLIF